MGFSWDKRFFVHQNQSFPVIKNEFNEFATVECNILIILLFTECNLSVKQLVILHKVVV